MCLMIPIYVDDISYTKYWYRDNVEYCMYFQYLILYIIIFQLTQLVFNYRTKNIPKIKFFEHMYEFTINMWKK